MLDIRRSLGQYSTPLQTAHYMARRLLSFFSSTENIRILDPAVGDGVFIRSLSDYGVATSQIQAFDIDPDVVRGAASLPCVVSLQDFLSSPVNHVDSGGSVA